MQSKSFVLGLAVATLFATSAAAEEPDGEQLVDALNAVFGAHPATRASHAKGICVKGSFSPAAGASELSEAPQFEKPVTILGRFSIGGGNPKAADNAKGARGLALRFELDDGDYSDFVMLSAPIFFAKTPAQVVEFLKVRAPVPGGDGPDQDQIKAFSAANPETTRQGAWLASKPVPASYAAVNYWGIHAFTLTNASGETKTVKFKLMPLQGEAGLTDEEAKEKDPGFYAGELKERLAEGPASFALIAVIGDEGDETADPTVMWDEDARSKVPLGTLAIEAIEDSARCDEITFDPANLPDGIDGPESDAIFAARSGAYAVSLTRRAAP